MGAMIDHAAPYWRNDKKALQVIRPRMTTPTTAPYNSGDKCTVHQLKFFSCSDRIRYY